jgi:hypothetical protein
MAFRKFLILRRPRNQADLASGISATLLSRAGGTNLALETGFDDRDCFALLERNKAAVRDGKEYRNAPRRKPVPILGGTSSG